MEAAPALPWAAAMPHLLGHMAFGTPLPTSYLPSLPLGAGGARASNPAKIPREDTAAIHAFDGEPRVAASAVNGGSPVPRRPRRKFRKSVTLDPDKVAQLGLRPGKNVIAFSFSSRVWGRQEVQAHAYLWDWNAKIVVSDVDGTITKSDLRGHVAAMVGKDWNHEGVAQLYNNIRDNGYQLMFLSSRAISHSKGTRRYLEKLTQDGETLTQGPVMLAPDPLSTALYREVVVRRPQEFKMRCLKTIRDLFPPDWNPFYAGFGNRETDTVSYAHVGVPPGRNFTINPKSEVVAETTRHTKTYSLAGINRLVYEVFPPVARHRRTRSGAADLTHCDTFADSNYWGKGFLNIDEIELP
jgi:phosphatidate phosphatase LPIN